MAASLFVAVCVSLKKMHEFNERFKLIGLIGTGEDFILECWQRCEVELCTIYKCYKEIQLKYKVFHVLVCIYDWDCPLCSLKGAGNDSLVQFYLSGHSQTTAHLHL